MALNYSHYFNSSVVILEFQEAELFPNDSVTLVFRWLLFGVVCQVINVFGVVTNVINIVCFIKQGFQDTVNISLLGLAVSDIGCLTTLTWTNVCFTPAFLAADLPIDSVEFQHLTSGAPHGTFTRITSCITAFITLERCLCITMPLKVKDIFTNRRVSTIIICIFLTLIASVSPMYVVNWLGWKYVPQRNKTVLGLLFAENHEQVESVFYSVNNVAIPGIAFLVTIVCTTVLVITLKRGTHWMKKSMVNEQADKLAVRNQRIARMVLMISTLFICCFMPISIVFLAMSLEPEFSLVGKYRNALSVVGGFGVVLEAVNASANIFIYSSMSSRYRAALEEALCMKAEKDASNNLTNSRLKSAEKKHMQILNENEFEDY